MDVGTGTDIAGNSTARAATYTVVDTTPPVATLALATNSVEMPLTNTATFSCSDAGSGIASCLLVVTHQSGSILLTSSNPGTIALPVSALGVYTVTVTALDRGGNVASNTQQYSVVDTTPPTASISVTTPTVTIGQTNTTTFSCTDGGSGIASCLVTVTAPNGTVTTLSNGPNGGTIPVPVVQAGTYAVSVTATDVAGRTAVAVATYSVRLCVIEIYDWTQAKQIGSNYTIRIMLCDANGKNISSRNIVLTAVSVSGANGVSFPPGPNDSGSANTGFEFRFSEKSYVYNLDTTGFPFIIPGSYTLNFTTAPVPDPTHPPPSLGSARFTLRM